MARGMRIKGEGEQLLVMPMIRHMWFANNRIAGGHVESALPTASA